MEIKVIKNILEANEAIAEQNRKLKEEKRLLMVNIIGSPGAGKTSLILKTVEKLGVMCGVIEGDIASDIDARRLAEGGVAAVQINTGGACHLDANMVHTALKEIDFSSGVLFVENVGNLVCPAEFEIGEDFKVAVVSVAEGDDKPYKYPLVFSKAGAVVLSKVDLLPYIDFNRKFFYDGIRSLNPTVKVFEVSCKSGEGVEEWCAWLRERFRERSGFPSA